MLWTAVGVLGGSATYGAIAQSVAGVQESVLVLLVSGAMMGVPTIAVIAAAVSIGTFKGLRWPSVGGIGLIGGLLAVPFNMLSALMAACALGAECV